ncbi:MAG: RNA-directed DNA polymerase [Bacteroidales bacterium]|nr:RNA-directed DNA polymerase [Bacteroidales bacterium]
MKRFGNLWSEIASRENVEKAVCAALVHQRENAQKRKFLENREFYTDEICSKLQNGTFEFSPLYEFKVYEPKERIIHCPTLYDKVAHHAIMDVCKPYIISKMTNDTYGSIKGRGLQMCANRIKTNRHKFADWYYVQIDCKKFYQSIPHDKLKQTIRRVFKDKTLLKHLDKIIDRHEDSKGRGLAIGVFPSQYLSNLFLSELDHFAKEQLRLKWYFRYMDDIVCFVKDKQSAHSVLETLSNKIESLGLTVKENARIVPFRCGLDFIGYKFYPTHTLLRKRIKMNIKKKSNHLKNADDDTWKMQMASYYGWLKHCDGKNLLKTIKGDRMIEYKKLSEKRPRPSWFDVPKEQRKSIMALCESGREIVFIDYMDVEIKKEKKVVVKYIYADENCDNPTFHTFITKSAVIMDRLSNDKELMPFSARIIKKKNYMCYE